MDYKFNALCDATLLCCSVSLHLRKNLARKLQSLLDSSICSQLFGSNARVYNFMSEEDGRNVKNLSECI